MNNNQSIPKEIHYIWFGRGEKSDLIKKCIETTKEILGDWEIKEWNEDNYDIERSKYMKEAYDCKKYAFAADFARYDILYNHGGVYLDTDVELIKRIPDSFLEDEGFAGMEGNNKVAPGLVFAVKPNNPIVKEIIDDYNKDRFLENDGNYNYKTVVDRTTEVLQRHGFELSGKEQIIEGIHIYPCDYFCAYDFIAEDFDITDNTISIHHYEATWLKGKTKIKRKIRNILRKTLGINNYKKILMIKRKLFGVNGE